MTDNDLRRHLADVEAQLRTLRGESEGLTEQVGGQEDGALDAEDTAAALTNAEENGALIDLLEQRRESLLRQIDQDG